MADTEKIKSLLGTGLNIETVAAAVGCDQSYISQLMSNEEFAAEVVTLRAAALTAATDRDRSIDAVEDKLLGKLERYADSHILDLNGDKLLRAFSIVNRAVRRGVPQNLPSAPVHQTAILNISKNVINNFVLNTTGEVVEVEGQTMVTMPAAALLSNLAAKQKLENPDNATVSKYAEVAKYLPPSS